MQRAVEALAVVGYPAVVVLKDDLSLVPGVSVEVDRKAQSPVHEVIGQDFFGDDFFGDAFVQWAVESLVLVAAFAESGNKSFILEMWRDPQHVFAIVKNGE